MKRILIALCLVSACETKPMSPQAEAGESPYCLEVEQDNDWQFCVGQDKRTYFCTTRGCLAITCGQAP